MKGTKTRCRRDDLSPHLCLPLLFPFPPRLPCLPSLLLASSLRVSSCPPSFPPPPSSSCSPSYFPPSSSSCLLLPLVSTFPIKEAEEREKEEGGGGRRVGESRKREGRRKEGEEGRRKEEGGVGGRSLRRGDNDHAS